MISICVCQLQSDAIKREAVFGECCMYGEKHNDFILLYSALYLPSIPPTSCLQRASAPASPSPPISFQTVWLGAAGWLWLNTPSRRTPSSRSIHNHTYLLKLLLWKTAAPFFFADRVESSSHACACTKWVVRIRVTQPHSWLAWAEDMLNFSAEGLVSCRQLRACGRICRRFPA